MYRLLIIIWILLIAERSTIDLSQKQQPIEIFETNPTNVSSAFNQYIIIATYFGQQADVPYIATFLVKEGLPSHFKQSFASLSDLSASAVFAYFKKHPEFVVGMQAYLSTIIRRGYISHDTGKRLLRNALQESIKSLKTTPSPITTLPISLAYRPVTEFRRDPHWRYIHASLSASNWQIGHRPDVPGAHPQCHKTD